MSGLSVSDVIPKKTAIKMLVARLLERNAGDKQQVIWKVKRRVSRAIKSGHLSQLSSNQVVFGDLSAWAQDTWPGTFNDWPRNIKKTEHYSFVDWGYFHLPETLEECHAAIKALHAQLMNALAEIERLRPDAEAWRKYCASRKRGGTTPKKSRGS